MGERKKLRYGIVGTGSIATEFVDALESSSRCEAYAVASRSAERAAEFGERHDIPVRYGAYEKLLADPRVDVVYVATPHPHHAAMATAAVEAGKHVLCEKPLTVDAREAGRVIAAARESGVLVMEAFAYLFHPQTDKLLELIRNDVIGSVRTIDISFSFHNPSGRALDRSLGGGGILDVGCYCVSASRQIAGAASGLGVVEPGDLVALARLDEHERVDRYAMAIMRFSGEILAQVSCGVAVEQDDHIWVYGTRGCLYVPQPCWTVGCRDTASRIIIRRPGRDPEDSHIPGGRNIFSLEADGFAQLLGRGPDAWERSHEDTLANMRTLDRWRAAVGVTYDIEEPEGEGQG